MRFYVLSRNRTFCLDDDHGRVYLDEMSALKDADQDSDYIHVVTVTTHDVILNPALGPEL